jgi:hypothetical protein
MSSKKYQDLCRGSKTRFRRYTGVSTFVFELMVLLVRQYEEETKIKTGRPSNLSVEDRVLLLLEYYRENRTFFHLGMSYSLSESNVYRNIVKIEDILMRTGYFRLGGKKLLLSDKEIKKVYIDVTETPAQRPKKSPQ